MARIMGPTWGPPGSCRPQVGPMWAPQTLLSGKVPGQCVHSGRGPLDWASWNLVRCSWGTGVEFGTDLSRNVCAVLGVLGSDWAIHYNDAIMGTIASQINRPTTVYSTVYSDGDQRKRKSSASLAFLRGIHIILGYLVRDWAFSNLLAVREALGIFHEIGLVVFVVLDWLSFSICSQLLSWKASHHEHKHKWLFFVLI